MNLARISHTLSGNLHTLLTNLGPLAGEAVVHKHCPRLPEGQDWSTKWQFSARLCEKCGLDNLSEYIIPIVILLLYFVSSMRKQKKATATPRGEPQEELLSTQQAPPPVPRPVEKTNGPPPVHRKQEELRSQIEDRKVTSSITTREYSSAITGRQGPISSGMLEHLSSDPAYALKGKTEASRAKKLFQNKKSLRDAFLLQEILRRPYQ